MFSSSERTPLPRNMLAKSEAGKIVHSGTGSTNKKKTTKSTSAAGTKTTCWSCVTSRSFVFIAFTLMIASSVIIRVFPHIDMDVLYKQLLTLKSKTTSAAYYLTANVSSPFNTSNLFLPEFNYSSVLSITSSILPSLPVFTTGESAITTPQPPLTPPKVIPTTQTPILSKNNNAELKKQCKDPIWCSIPMPSTSLFKFSPPTDETRWVQAQIDAASGRHILLERILRVFPQPFDFLDGDVNFRNMHQKMDLFIDAKNWFQPLLPPKQQTAVTPVDSLPPPYDYRAAKRSPLVSVGFTAFEKINAAPFFEGPINEKKSQYLPMKGFVKEFQAVKDKLDVPAVYFLMQNENWGWLSSHFPNRTGGWGRCCEKPEQKKFISFINHPSTLAVAVNQHSNLSHPKVIVLPRGLPVAGQHEERVLWDSMRAAFKSAPKSKLLVSIASNWGPRPQIIKCISKSVSADLFDGHASQKKDKSLRKDKMAYYNRLAGARTGVCLPGIGYDTFRAWEYLMMGTVAVIERGVGFDRTMWRLPALFVDDFIEITPALLRAAYVEAMYRKDEFEFERLQQSWWWSVFANISSSQSTQPLLEKFPMEAESPMFARAYIPYECGKTNTCGPGTKRIPTRTC